MKTRWLGFVLWMVAALASGGADAATADCSDVAGMPTTASVAAAGAALWKDRGDELEPELLPADVAAVAALRVQLAAVVGGVALCLGTEADANAFDAAVAALKLPEHVKLQARSFHDGDLLGVVAHIAIPCGDDAQLFVYERHERRWQPMLRWDAGPYSRIDKAWGTFQYDISARGADGQWFVATAHVRPWCSSTWSVLDYAVARPGVVDDRPRLVLEDHADIWFGGDDLGRLRIDGSQVEWRFHAASLDLGLHNREHVRRYAIDVDRATRVAPVADSARDFVDEWITSSWRVAREWTDEKASVRLASAHADLAKRSRAAFTFGETRRCSGDTVEVELQHDGEASFHFRIDAAKAFTLRSISREIGSECTEVVPEPAQRDAMP